MCVEPTQRGKVGQHEYKISPARQWCGLQEGREPHEYFMHVYMSFSTSRLPEKICRSRCGRLKHAGALISEHTGTHTRQVILTKQLVRTWILQHSQGARRQQMHTYTQTSASEHWSRSKRCMWSFHTDPAFSHLPDNAHILGPTHQTARHNSMKPPFTIMWNKELSKRQKKEKQELRLLIEPIRIW